MTRLRAEHIDQLFNLFLEVFYIDISEESEILDNGDMIFDLAVNFLTKTNILVILDRVDTFVQLDFIKGMALDERVHLFLGCFV